MDFVGTGARLTPADIAGEAGIAGLDPAIIHALLDVETAGSGFLSDGRPKILFEAHQFWKDTEGRFGASNISAPLWDASLYGAGGAHQYDRLAQAMALDATAGLRSASWGLGQIMGANAELVGFVSAELFVEAMKTGERAQLDAVLRFVAAAGIAPAMRAQPPHFGQIAEVYNGPGYAQHGYDVKLAAAWRKWRAAEVAPAPTGIPRTAPELYHATLQLGSQGPAVTALQQELHGLGYELAVDGDFGPETLAIIVALQRHHGVAADGIVGPATRIALSDETRAAPG